MPPNGLNGMLPKLAVGLASAGIMGAVAVYGTQRAQGQQVETNKDTAADAAELAHSNAIAIAAISKWIEIDRERSRAARVENMAAHEKILDKLDEIKKAQ